MALEEWKAVLEIPQIDIVDYSPLTLAYIGDCVYELFIRSVLVTRGNTPVDRLNREASHYAKAVTQAKLVMSIMEELTETEQAVFRRGRNAKSPTKAKNATMMEYRTATGFEALLGYLYLTEQFDRLVQLVRMAFDDAGMYEAQKK